jgi:hypothetical protein
MNGKPWQHDQISELRRLWKEGLTGSDIAQTLGMSRSAVIGKTKSTWPHWRYAGIRAIKARQTHR